MALWIVTGARFSSWGAGERPCSCRRGFEGVQTGVEHRLRRDRLRGYPDSGRLTLLWRGRLWHTLEGGWLALLP